MGRGVIVLLLLFVIPQVFADSLFNSKSITVDIDISSSSKIVGEGYVDNAIVNLTFFPQDFSGQKVVEFEASPTYEKSEGVVRFAYNKPKDSLDFNIKSKVATTNYIPTISEKVKFPITTLEPSLLPYTRPSLTIDSDNEDIIKTASKIVEGEDDLYGAAFKLAHWTKSNINYNLTTLTADVSQKASWVLKNKKGVCDELTSLFIAMLRSVGVPARFVSGISYTNSDLFEKEWGPHGWAEVYFPKFGWVPFDVTYGEYGWVDPTHIKFRDSIDSDEPSTFYQWFGEDSDIETDQLDIEVSLVNFGPQAIEPIRINVQNYREAVRFGSYNLIEATVENLNGYYYATELHLSKPKEVIIIDEKSKSIFLRPRERKTITWIVQVDEFLNNRFTYTFPIIVSTSNNITSETEFISNINNRHISYSEVRERSEFYEEKPKKYLGDVSLQCQGAEKDFYEFEDVRINCYVKNNGNIFLENANLCVDDRCKTISLGISQARNYTFNLTDARIGLASIPIELKSPLVKRTGAIDISVNDAPQILIQDLIFPENVSYDGSYTLSFDATKKSFSIPSNVEVVMKQNGKIRKWEIEKFNESQEYIIDFRGKNLKFGENDYSIEVTYNDLRGNIYKTAKEFKIDLVDATTFQRVALLVNEVDFTLNSTITIISSGAAIFVVWVMILFRQK